MPPFCNYERHTQILSVTILVKRGPGVRMHLDLPDKILDWSKLKQIADDINF